jgi:hypothetical protein
LPISESVGGARKTTHAAIGLARVSEKGVRIAMQVAFNIVRLSAGLFVLLARHGDADLQKAAGGWVGVVVGYWLK